VISIAIQADRRCLVVGNSDRRSDGTSTLNAGIKISGGDCRACPTSIRRGHFSLKWYATRACPAS
jgi:hypothetical protein